MVCSQANMTITADDPAELEEERRLCYVGITRAEKDLTLTCARKRMVHGETQYKKNVPFLKRDSVRTSGNRTVHKEREERRKRTGKSEDFFHAGKRSFQDQSIYRTEAGTAVRYTEGRKASLRSRGPCETYQIRRRNRDCDHGRRKRLLKSPLILTDRERKRCLQHLPDFRKCRNQIKYYIQLEKCV